MAYITSTDLEKRFGTAAKLAQFTNETGTTPDTAVVAEVINSAEGEVNSYLAKRYAVPVNVSAYADAAATLKGVCLDLAVHNVHKRRPDVPETVAETRRAAVQWLDRVAKGEVSLPAATPPASTTAESAGVVFTTARADPGVQDMT